MLDDSHITLTPANIIDEVSMDTQLDKSTLRKQLQQRRNNLSSEEQKTYSEITCQRINKSSVFQSAKHIAFYTPVNGEISPLSLSFTHNTREKSFYLPLLSRQHEHHLFFVKINEETRYKNNIYNIPEPIYKDGDILPIEDLDLVIMPLVAADKRGNRLGMGGGYYDRSFEFKKNNKTNKNPLLMGLAYDFQIVTDLVAEDWDVPLDYLASNHALIKIIK